jgi:hypothetical protein
LKIPKAYFSCLLAYGPGYVFFHRVLLAAVGHLMPNGVMEDIGFHFSFLVPTKINLSSLLCL